jgi:hypothetical protein
LTAARANLSQRFIAFARRGGYVSRLAAKPGEPMSDGRMVIPAWEVRAISSS